MIDIILKPRAGVQELIDAHIRGEIPYDGTDDSLYAQIYRMGYSCNSLYEMVIAAERSCHVCHDGVKYPKNPMGVCDRCGDE